jgi:hypothetical protein
MSQPTCCFGLTIASCREIRPPNRYTRAVHSGPAHDAAHTASQKLSPPVPQARSSRRTTGRLRPIGYNFVSGRWEWRAQGRHPHDLQTLVKWSSSRCRRETGDGERAQRPDHRTARAVLRGSAQGASEYLRSPRRHTTPTSPAASSRRRHRRRSSATPCQRLTRKQEVALAGELYGEPRGRLVVRHRSNLSRSGASDKPGAVQSAVMTWSIASSLPAAIE